MSACRSRTAPIPYVHESRLINYKYFFTRKLTFMKESDAFVLFPGGFGTLDESFELLTLIQTGKSDLHPVIMLEAPGTGFWGPWAAFVDSTRRTRNDRRTTSACSPSQPTWTKPSTRSCRSMPSITRRDTWTAT